MKIEEALKIKKLSELLWIADKKPRNFEFLLYFEDINDVLKISQILKKYEAYNINIKFTNFLDNNYMFIGPGSCISNSLIYSFTKPLLKEIIRKFGTLYFFIDTDDGEGVSYTINKYLNIIDVVECNSGG